jgi:hypothetical protein
MICLLIFLKQTAFGQKKIFDTEAKDHIGETFDVSGKVNNFKVFKHSNKTLLFCGANYLKYYFTVLVENNNGLPTEHAKLIGWNISVAGSIIKYKGMPAIKVSNWNDVQTALFVDNVPVDL